MHDFTSENMHTTADAIVRRMIDIEREARATGDSDWKGPLATEYRQLLKRAWEDVPSSAMARALYETPNPFTSRLLTSRGLFITGRDRVRRSAKSERLRKTILRLKGVKTDEF